MAVSVPQTDTGGRGENPQANEPILVQELGKKADVPSVYVLPRAIGVAANDPLPTVYQKHRSVLKLKADVYGLMPGQCQKVKPACASRWAKP